MDVGGMYARYGPVVLRRARRLLGNESDAKDVLQDVFARVAAGDAPWRGQASPMTWLYRITTNLCLNRLRDARTRARIVDAEVPASTGAAGGVEARVDALRLLSLLPADSASLAIYLYVDEMTHEEIAQVVGCSRRHVGNLVRRLEGELKERALCPA